jgi:uncharacterized protein YecT (DUF1311 family)
MRVHMVFLALALLGISAFGAEVQSVDNLPESRGWEKFCAPFSEPTRADVAQARSRIVQRACKEPANQSILTWCAGHRRVAAEAQLGSAYSRVRKVLPDQASKERLAVAQRTWCRYREAVCTFDVPPDAQGSMMPMLLADCFASYAANRADSLAAFAQCLETDSCGRPVNFYVLDLHPELRPKPQVRGRR